MTPVVAGVGDGAKPGTIVFDLDGVLYIDRHGIPGAGDTLEHLAWAGHRLLFATNNSTKSVETVRRHIHERTGYAAADESIATSAHATARYLEGEVGTALVVGSPALTRALEDHGIEVVESWSAAEAVVVGLDRDLTYERLTGAVLAIRAGARFVATGLDATYPSPEGLYPGAGSIVSAVATATSVIPVACGKPEEPMRSLVKERIDHRPVWVVGDRPETDLAMGIVEGWGTILVMTGVTGNVEEVPGELRPDLVIDSVVDLLDVLS